MSDLGEDGGWIASTDAWIRLVQDHPTRTLLLDGVVLEELGDVAGRLVLDLGCGEGRFSRLLTARGARSVGLDPILPMVEAARRAGQSEQYVQGAGESCRSPTPASIWPLHTCRWWTSPATARR